MTDEAKQPTEPTPAVQPAPRAPLFEMVGPLPELFAALSKAQGEFPEIVKDMTANAGKFSYDYADLALVLRKIRPALAGNGLALINPLAGGTASGFMVRTMLLHSSGAYISSTTIIPYQDDPQEFGIRVTYQRRYGDLAMVGIFPTAEDTDGKSQPTGPRQTTGQNPQKTEAPKPTPKPETKAAENNRKLNETAKVPDFRSETQAKRDEKPKGPIAQAMAEQLEEKTSPMIELDMHEEGVKNNVRFDPNGPMSDDQRKEISAAVHGGKAWPDSSGKPFREPYPPNGKGEQKPGERWACFNRARCEELSMRSAKVAYLDVKTFAQASELLKALRSCPDMPQVPEGAH